MKARLIRFVFALHRWMGVTLGLLMLLWCVSGVVMIWQPYPSITLGDRDYRIEGLAPIVAPDRIALPRIPLEATLSNAQIEMLAGRPVISLAWQAGEEGGKGLYDLTTGQKIDKITEADALGVASTYLARHGLRGNPTLTKLMERDEFTVAGYLNAARPLYEIALNDPEETALYISSTLGQLIQRTTAAQRFWSWLGPIPHWLYFTELRRDAKLWGQIIIWTSLAGCFLTLLGLFVGIRQLRRRHSTGKLASPYHRSKFWHHMLGLIFGVLVLTFTFSGFASMQPWGWLESGKAAGEAADRLTGKPVAWSQARAAIEAQAIALRTISRERSLVSFSTLEGKPWFTWRAADGSRRRFDAAGQPSPFDDASRARAALLLSGDAGPTEISLMTLGDEYYYPGAASSDLPVVRIEAPAMDHTRFYLDPDTGTLRFIADDGARGFRFWHLALHTFDFLPSPFQEIILVLLMLGVTAVCGLGAWMGLKKLARGGKLDNTPKDEAV